MRFPALGLFAAAVAVAVSLGGGSPAAPVPKHLMKDADDLQAMQGLWKVTEYTLNGQPIGGTGELTLEFRGGTVVATAEKENLRTTAAVKLDPKASPPRLAWGEAKATDLKGQPVQNAGAEKAWAMIYKFDADTLVLAANVSNQAEPPKSFDGKDGSATIIMTLTRVKK